MKNKTIFFIFTFLLISIPLSSAYAVSPKEELRNALEEFVLNPANPMNTINLILSISHSISWMTYAEVQFEQYETDWKPRYLCNSGGGSNPSIPQSQSISVVIEGDANGDGYVNFKDQQLIKDNWGCTGTCQGDLNHDGVVDLTDLGILSANWNGDIMSENWDRTDCDLGNNWCNQADINQDGKVDLTDLGLWVS